MITKLLTAFALALIPTTTLLALTNDQFEKQMSAIRGKSYVTVEQFLESNRTALSDDPNYYVILLNYVLAKGVRTHIAIGQGAARKGDLVLNDPKTGNAVGFLGEEKSFDSTLVSEGIDRTRSALPKFHSRLDIHFGVIAAAQRIERWDIVGDQLVEILKVSKEPGLQWSWGPVGSMEGDPQEFMLENVMARTSGFFRMDTPTADKEFLKVSNALVKYYPDRVYGFANLGVFNLAKNNLPEAEKYLKQALAIDPKDEVVLGNIQQLEQMRKR